MKRVLGALPPWCLTVLTLTAILWLTLAPHPLGETTVPLFEGADKIVHAIMFGFLTAMIVIDHARRDGWEPPSILYIMSAALLSTCVGAIIEVLQLQMALGRGFEWGDIIADGAGALVSALGMIIILRKS